MFSAKVFDLTRIVLVTALATVAFSWRASAANDPGPTSLPGEVVGVIGSGDRLSLRIKAGQEVRTLNIGDVFEDGWALTGLTDATATLSRNGQSQTVGLNPSGRLDLPKTDEPASSVRTIGSMTKEELLARQVVFNQLVGVQLGPWDGKTPRMGLTLAETQRYVAYQARGAIKQDSGPPGKNGFLSMGQVDGLGEDKADYLALNQKLLDAMNAERGVRFTLTFRAAPGVVMPPEMVFLGQDLTEANLTTVIVPDMP
ncbi:MAG: hypothetical protein JWM33_1203, partial [Caulobacteraceae bacterium]|nr:hypothetical protein [Caulobacteraceae bacterium]